MVTMNEPLAGEKLAVGERRAAELIGVSDRTLWGWRKTGIGPRFVRVGKRVLYPVDGLRDFVNGKVSRGIDQ